LPIGGPLHEFDELDLAPIASAAKPGKLLLIRLPPFGRPFPPRTGEAMPQRLEAGEMRQQRAALVAELLETLAALRAGIRLEIFESRAQRAPFQFGDAGIIDRGGLPQPRQSFPTGIAAVFRNGFHVDVECIEEQPAVR